MTRRGGCALLPLAYTLRTWGLPGNGDRSYTPSGDGLSTFGDEAGSGSLGRCVNRVSGSLRLGSEQPEFAKICEDDVAIVGCDVEPVVTIEAGIRDLVGLQL